MIRNYIENKLNSFNRVPKKVFVTKYYFPSLLFGLFLVFTTLFPFTASAQNDKQIIKNKEWLGSYYFSETAQSPKKRNSYDVVPSVNYDITVEEKNSNLVASFSANGVQLFEAYNCLVVISDNKIEFYYQSLDSPSAQNFRKLKKGDLLFSLSKIQTGKSTKYLFQPAIYKIVRIIPAKQKMPIYFEKLKTPFSSMINRNAKYKLLANYQTNLLIN
jgi:hypothetical protein